MPVHDDLQIVLLLLSEELHGLIFESSACDMIVTISLLNSMETATDDNEISFGSSRIINLRDFF